MPTDAQRRAALERFANDFCKGAYWDAHEHLEALWREERLPAWQAVIQLAAVFVLLQSGRHEGARSVLARARAKLASAPTHLHGVDVLWIRERLGALSSALDDKVVADVGTLACMFDGLHERLGVASP